MPFALSWRFGLAACVVLLVACSTATTAPRPVAPAIPVTLRDADGYQVQQRVLRAGQPRTPERWEYCREYQCAYSADKTWCMRGCYLYWDLGDASVVLDGPPRESEVPEEPYPDLEDQAASRNP